MASPRCSEEESSSGVLRTQKLKPPSVENPELTNDLPSKPRVGQNIA